MSGGCIHCKQYQLNMMEARLEQKLAVDERAVALKDVGMLVQELADARAQIAAAKEILADLLQEGNEQARVNGMGAEREAALLGKFERLKAEMTEAIELLRWIKRNTYAPTLDKIDDRIDAFLAKHKEQP